MTRKEIITKNVILPMLYRLGTMVENGKIMMVENGRIIHA